MQHMRSTLSPMGPSSTDKLRTQTVASKQHDYVQRLVELMQEPLPPEDTDMPANREGQPLAPVLLKCR